jgi:hypothetical protein
MEPASATARRGFFCTLAALDAVFAALLCDMVNPKSLANLKPVGPGQSGNPSGKGTHARRIPIQNSLIRILEEIEVGKDMRGKGPVVDRLMLAWCKRWLELVDKAKTAEDLQTLTEAMVQMQAISDDKEMPPTVELTAPPAGAETKATKTSTVILQGGEVVKQEETRTVTQTVELTGGTNVEQSKRPDNGSKRGKS